MAKKIMMAVLMAASWMMAAAQWDGSASPWTQGSGTGDDPYLIESAEQLAYLAEMTTAGVNDYNGKHFLLTQDISLSNQPWMPIGDNNHPFKGNFDGGDHIIDNLYVTTAGYNYRGLFGYAEGCTLKNIRLGKVTITSGADYSGGIAGCICSSTTDNLSAHVRNCQVGSGTISNNSSNCMGGIVGVIGGNSMVEVERCKNYANLSGYAAYVGGIIGYSSIPINILRCENYGDISTSCDGNQNGRVGGIIGSTEQGGTVKECFNRGSITASTFAGSYSAYWLASAGIVVNDGTSSTLSVVSCYNTGAISIYGARAVYACGICYNATVKNCYNTGTLSGGYKFGVSSGSAANSYYRDGCGATTGGSVRTEAQMKSVSFPVILNSDSTVFVMDSENENGGYPVFARPPERVSTLEATNTTSYSTTLHGSHEGLADSVGYIWGYVENGEKGIRQACVTLPTSSNVQTLTLSNSTAGLEYWYVFFAVAWQWTVYGDTMTVATYPLYDVQANVNNSAWGTVSGTGAYGYGITAMLTAIPTQHYQFVQWSDGNTSNPRAVTVVSDTSLTAIFEVARYNVSVTINNEDWGSVTGTGIYEYNSSAMLTATATEGHHFQHWTNEQGTWSYAINPWIIDHVTEDTNAIAVFEPNQYNVTVQANDDAMGTVTGSGTYTHGQQVYITAVPTGSYIFSQWSDGNSQAYRLITVTEDVTYTAIFTDAIYTLTAQSNNSAFGYVIGGGSYAQGSEATLTAVPYDHYHFTQWSDGNTSNPRTVTVQDDATYTAQFAADSYTVTVQSDDPMKGSVSGNGVYTFGQTASIAATPYAHYHFVEWNDGNNANPRSVTVMTDTQFVASFATNSYTIVAESEDVTKGIVAGGGSYEYGSQAVLTATSANHYHFTQWSDGNTSNPRTVTVQDDATYTAQFAADSYDVTVQSGDPMKGSVSGNGVYTFGQTASITATPFAHYHFVEWNDGNNANPRNVTVMTDTQFVASFAANSYTIVAESEDVTKGIVAGGGSYEYGSQAVLTATAANHYHFTQWSDGNTSNPCTVTVQDDATYTAQFATDSYVLNVSSSNAIMGQASGGGVYTYGTYATLTATPMPHHYFVGWNDGVVSNPRVVTVSSDSNFVANFEQMPLYTISVVSNDESQGLVSGGGQFYAGEQTIISATALSDHQFLQWNDGNTDQIRTITVTGDATYMAYFGGMQYMVNVYSNDDNLGTVSGTGSYERGQQATVTATPAEGCRFVRWSNGIEANPYTFTVQSNVSLIANFERTTGIDEAEMLSYAVATRQGHTRVIGAEGHSVKVTDMVGHIVFDTEKYNGEWVTLPSAGVYMVSVDGVWNKKIVIIK